MFYLASNSPRRQELIQFGGWSFEVVSVDIDETPLFREEPRKYVLRLAKDKANVAASKLSQGVIVAADTTVAFHDMEGEIILGKPHSAEKAMWMLRRLRDRSHNVYTALAIINRIDGALIIDECITEVQMRNYKDEEMMAYIVSGDPFDKAGGYAIQHKDFHPVKEIIGCYANVMGMPLCHLSRSLEQLNIIGQKNLRSICKSYLSFTCKVSKQVLQWNHGKEIVE